MGLVVFCALSGLAAPPARGSDAWLADWARSRQARALQTGQVIQALEAVEKVILARGLVARRAADETWPTLIEVHRGLELLASARTDQQRREVAWVLSHPSLAGPFLHACPMVADPLAAVAKLAELARAETKAVEQYPALAVAFATAEVRMSPRPQPDPAGLVESFRWYTTEPDRFSLDLKALPVEVLWFLADTRLSIAERKWALARYGSKSEPQKAYFDVDYDKPHFKTGAAQKISGMAYTLANLKSVGGVCVDQAYYATEVLKALGIPAAAIQGHGGSGVPHAWVAYLRADRTGRRMEWDASTARYRRYKFYIGKVFFPPRGSGLLDGELKLLAPAAGTQQQLQRQAEALAAGARLLAGRADSAASAGLEPIRAAAGGNDDLSWLPETPQSPIVAIESLLAESLSAEAACRQAWDLAVDLQRQDRLDAQATARLIQVLSTRTAAEYPDFAYLVLRRLAGRIDDTQQRRNAYRRAIRQTFRARKDLQNRLTIALGDDYRRAGENVQALQLYRAAAGGSVEMADIVVAAASRACQIYQDQGQHAAAVRMVEKLYARTEPVEASDFFRAQTSHYQLGMMLAELLEATGRTQRAERLRQQLSRQ
ncbi:MAG: tetratricopeptide repeat protein [Phycisphaerae bacterium]